MSLPQTEILFAQINWQPLFEEQGIPLAIMGLVVVFAALTLLRVFIGLLPWIVRGLDHFYPEHVEAVPDAPCAAPTTTASSEEMSDELLVVITAAVAAVVAQPHRIVRMREFSSEDLIWSLEGRLQHHGSHRIQTQESH